MASAMPFGVEPDLQELQNKWYNTVVSALGLNKESFQIFQASNPLPNTSEGIWQIFNTVPPESLSDIFSSSFNSFYDDYSGVVLTVIPQDSDQWRIAMGDYLTIWTRYQQEHSKEIEDGTNIITLFNRWADANIPDPGIATRVKTLFFQLRNGVVPRAVERLSLDLTEDRKPKFSKTILDLRDALKHGQTRAINFDSSTASGNVNDTWAKVNAGGSFCFFFGGASGQYSQLSRRAASARVTATGEFKNAITFAAVPGAWFSSAALGLAHNTRDNTVWPAGVQPSWDTTFGPNGNFQRLAVELVACDGLSMKITSEMKYSAEEQTQVRESRSNGVWPFVYTSRSVETYSKIEFNQQGYMELTIDVPSGNPSILGVNVVPVSNIVAESLLLGAYDNPHLSD